jgi:hypothetical protein
MGQKAKNYMAVLTVFLFGIYNWSLSSFSHQTEHFKWTYGHAITNFCNLFTFAAGNSPNQISSTLHSNTFSSQSFRTVFSFY